MKKTNTTPSPELLQQREILKVIAADVSAATGHKIKLHGDEYVKAVWKVDPDTGEGEIGQETKKNGKLKWRKNPYGFGLSINGERLCVDNFYDCHAAIQAVQILGEAPHRSFPAKYVKDANKEQLWTNAGDLTDTRNGYVLYRAEYDLQDADSIIWGLLRYGPAGMDEMHSLVMNAIARFETLKREYKKQTGDDWMKVPTYLSHLQSKIAFKITETDQLLREAAYRKYKETHDE